MITRWRKEASFPEYGVQFETAIIFAWFRCFNWRNVWCGLESSRVEVGWPCLPLWSYLFPREHVKNLCFSPPQFCRHWCSGFTRENGTCPLNTQPWLSHGFAGILAQTYRQKARKRVTILPGVSNVSLRQQLDFYWEGKIMFNIQKITEYFS